MTQEEISFFAAKVAMISLIIYAVIAIDWLLNHIKITS